MAPPTAPAAEIADRLDDSSYAARERTMLQLWRDYQHSRDRVRELATSSNPEVAQRAAWILRRWEIGLMAELPESVRRQIADAEGQPAVALAALLDDGYLREAVEVARQQSGAAASDEVRAQLGEVVAHRYLGIVDQARRTASLDLVVELLDQCAESTSLAVARALLLDRLGRLEPRDGQLDLGQLLPACADRWTPARRDEVATIALAVLGRFDQAVALAERSRRTDLLSTVLLLDARWAALAAASRASIDPNLPVDASIAAYAMWMLAARQAGLEDQVAEAARRLATAHDRNGLVWRSLAVAGKLDQAIAAAEREDKAVAAELWATRQQFTKAFETLGVDPGNFHQSLAQIFDQLAHPAAGAPPTAAVANTQLDTLLAAARLLHVTGHPTAVIQTLRDVAALEAGDGLPEHARREAAMLALRMGHDDLLGELVIDEDDAELDDELGFHLGYLLGDRAPTFFTTVRAAILRMRPDDSPRARFGAAVDLFAGRLPAGWNRQADLETLYEQLTESSLPTDPAAQLGLFQQNVILRAAAMRPTYLLGDLFAGLGRSDLAERGYIRAAEQQDLPSILRYADVQLASGNTAAALRLYETAFERLQSDWSGEQLGFVEPINSPPPSAAAALAGRAVALRRLGREDQSAALWETLRLAPLNPVNDSSRDFIQRLGTLQQPQRQREAAELLLRFSAFERATDRNFYSQADAQATRLADEDPAAAARWMRIAVIGTLATPHMYPSGYLLTPARWETAEAVAAAQAGDAARVQARLDAALEYFPLNITMAEEDLPKIREAGSGELADAAMDRIFQTGLDYLERFGLDANTANNLAWVAALNERHYEPSLELARRAVFLVPDSVSYRDTLAELLFRVGRAEEAVQIQQQCLRDQPDLWHIHEQIARFRGESPPQSAGKSSAARR